MNHSHLPLLILIQDGAITPEQALMAVNKSEHQIATGKSSKQSSSASRKKKWRERHGESARRKKREYLKAWRAKRKGIS